MSINLEYIYNKDLNVKELYDFAVRDKATEEDYGTLAENFVGYNKPVLTSPANYQIRTSGNLIFDKETRTYYAREAGYVHYGEKEIILYPFLNINDTQTRLVAVVPTKNRTQENISVALIRNLCSMMGVEMAIPEDKLQQTVELYNNSIGGRVVLCEGKPPVNGRSAVVKLEYEIKTSIGTRDKAGKIDYKNRNFVNNVKKGELIATYIPAVEPEPGIDIFNHRVEPKMETPFTYHIGKGLDHNKVDNTIVSALEGTLKITEDNTINVTEDEIIDGDLDLNIGNMDINGNLIVKGNITPGFKVKAKGNISVDGNVEESDVECGGNLLCNGGIVGSEETEIVVKGNTKASFVRNGHLKCGGDVDIESSIMHSEIIANGRVKAITERKGKVVGGTISGRKGVQVFIAGNLSGVKTSFIAGVDLERENSLKELRIKIKENNEIIAKLKNALGKNYFENPKVFFQHLPQNKIPQIKKIIEGLKSSLQTKKHLEDEQIQLENANAEDKDAAIIFHKEAHEGTILQICNRHLVLEKGAHSPTRFIYDKESADIIPQSVASAEKKTKAAEGGDKK